MNLDEAFLDALEQRLRAGHKQVLKLPFGMADIVLYWEPRAMRERTFENYYSTVVRHVFVVEQGSEVNTFSTLLEALTCFDDKTKRHAVEIALAAMGIKP